MSDTIVWCEFDGVSYGRIDGPFEVDGIRYDLAAGRSVQEVRPMFSFEAERSGSVELHCSRPMNDTEIDQYLKTGRIAW